MSSQKNTGFVYTTIARPGRALAGAATVACALLGACDDEFEPTVADTSPVDHTPAAFADSPQQTFVSEFDVCPADRKIALVGDGCVDKSGVKGTWKAVKLFADGSVPLEGAGEPPAFLADYCEFTWLPSMPGNLPRPEYLGSLPGLASDCEVIWGQGDVLTDALADDLRAAHLDHLDAVDAATLAGGVRIPVSVAVLDSAPNAVVDATSKHGETIGELIRTLACPGGGACSTFIHYGLVLPHLGLDQVDWTHGGYYGSQGELARAIFGAVARWKKSGESPHMIINLSVGWEPTMFGGTGDPSKMPAPARAVFHALQYAACHGVLTVAAAGNATGDSCKPGPMAPAIWENHPAPTAATCDSYGINNSPSSSAYPLVHAVSGIERDNQPLQNTRPGGRPRLAAPAFVASAGPPLQPTTPLTGTSLAAAGVSGIAALAWSYEPGLTAGEVAQRIYDSALPIAPAAPAQFGSTDVIRRVSACQTLDSCAGPACPPVNCGPTKAPSEASLSAASLATVDALRTNKLVDTVPRLGLTTQSGCTDVCGDSVALFTNANGAATACEHDEAAGQQRYTSPQPEWPACPACFMSEPVATVYLALDTLYGAQTVDVSLEVLGTNGVQRFPFGPLQLSSGRVTEVPLPPTELASPALRATLHLTFPTGETQSNEIPIY